MGILQENIGLRIMEIRIGLGWTQNELAKKYRRCISQIQLLESGTNDPKISTLEKLADKLNCKIEDFLKPPTSSKPKRGRPRTSKAEETAPVEDRGAIPYSRERFAKYNNGKGESYQRYDNLKSP